MSTQYQINAQSRSETGTAPARRMRNAGRVPAIMYGAGEGNEMLSLDHNEIVRNLRQEAFHSAIIEVHTADGVKKAILRDVHMHPHRPQVLHVDLQRISETEKLHIAVRLHFVGEELAPGVKLEGGIMSHLITEVDIECLPADLPEYLEVDVSGLNIHDAVHLSDIKLPSGVVITTMARGGENQMVATVAAPQAVEEEEVAAPVEGEEAAAEAAAAPAEEAAKDKDKDRE